MISNIDRIHIFSAGLYPFADISTLEDGATPSKNSFKKKNLKLEDFPIPSARKLGYFASRKNTVGGAEVYRKRNEDRRKFGGKTSFPLKTRGGVLIAEDRRCIPDRRLGNIHLELIDVDDYSLPESFTAPYLKTLGKGK